MKNRASSLARFHLNRGALNIAGIYLLVGGAWILLSDTLVARTATSPSLITTLSILKGWLFILVTAVLLYGLVHRETSAIRDRETQLRLVIDAMPAQIAYLDDQRRYTLTNRNYQDWFGLTDPRGMGQTLEKAVGPVIYQDIAGQVAAVLAGKAVSADHAMAGPTGELTYFHSDFVPDRAADGRVQGFFQLSTDITPRKRAETEREQLLTENQHQKALLAAIFEVDPGGLAVLAGPQLEFVYVNPAYRYAVPNLEVDPLGKTYRTIWPEDTGHVDPEQLEQVLESGKPFQHNHLVRYYPDGTQRNFTLQARRIDWEDQKAVLIILWDVTELKKAERALTAANQKLAEVALFPEENPYPVARVLANGQVSYRNPAASDLPGWNLEIGTAIPAPIFGLVKQSLETQTLIQHDLQLSDRIYSLTISPILRKQYANVYAQDITERKQAEQAKERYQELFNQAFEASPNAQVISRKEDGLIQSINSSFERLFGYRREEVLGKTSLELGMFANPADREEAVRRLRDAPSMCDFEVEIRTKTGEVRQALLSIEQLQAGDETHLLTILQDVTERKQAEAQLRFQADLLENVHDAVIVTNLDLITIAWNKAAQRLYGWTAEEALGKSSRELLRSEMPDEQRQEIIRQLEQTGFYEGESLHSTKDGRRIVLENHTVFHYDINGKPDGFIASNRDITERKQYEQALRESQKQTESERQRWQGVVEGIADEVWVCDLERRMSLINLPSATAMGLEEFEGKIYSQIMEEVDILTLDGRVRPEEEAPLYRALRGEIARGEEIMRHRRTGRTRYRQYSAAPMRDAAGAITGAVAIVRDVTDLEEARANARLLTSENEIKQRLLEQREQERLGIARDLHDGPVQEILAAMYAVRGLRTSLEQQPEIAAQLAEIQERLNRQVGELRAFAGELRPPALVRFGLIKGITSHLESFREKHPEISVRFTPEQLDSELVPETPRLALYRVYQEAMNNILKHAQATQVNIYLHKDAGRVILEIVDNGKGFAVPKDPLELTQQGHLGLAGMRERTEAIGGEIEIEAKPGEGTRIRVTVPLKGKS